MHRLFLFLLVLGGAFPALPAQTPVAYAGPDQDLCVGDTVQLQGQGSNAGPVYTYQWSPNTWISDPTVPDPLVWPPVTTAYTLIVTSNNLSSAPDTVVVRAHPIPTADAGPDRDLCLGDTVLLDGSATGDPGSVYHYLWSPANTLHNPQAEDPKAFPLQNTTYYLQVQSLWGCAAPLDSVRVTIRPTAHADAGDNLLVCIGDSFQLQGQYVWTTADTLPSSSVTVAWSPPNLLSNPNQLNPGGLADSSRWYHLQVSAQTCVRMDSTWVTAFPRPVPVISRSGLDLLANGGLGGGTYQWYRNNVLIPGATSNVYTVPEPGCYSVVVAEGDCEGESDTVCIQSVGMEEWMALRRMEAFPNPFRDVVRLEMELGAGEELRFVLVDGRGQVVWEDHRRWGRGEHVLELNGLSLPAGLYRLQVRGRGGQSGIPLLHLPDH